MTVKLHVVTHFCYFPLKNWVFVVAVVFQLYVSSIEIKLFIMDIFLTFK